MWGVCISGGLSFPMYSPMECSAAYFLKKKVLPSIFHQLKSMIPKKIFAFFIILRILKPGDSIFTIKMYQRY